MKRHIVSRTERNILSALKRWTPTAPEEVLTAEARYRLQRVVLDAAETGDTRQSIADRHGYSVSQVERIIRTARRDRAAGRVPPLTAWRAHDEAITPEIGTVTIGIDTQPPMAASAVAWTGTDGSRAWILRLDGNVLTLADASVEGVPEPAPPTDAERYLFATLQDRAMLLASAVRMLQLAAGIAVTGTVDDDTLSVVAGLAAWQSRPRPLMDAVESFVDERRRA